MYPRALLLDLDDTILDDSSLVHQCWRDACADHAHQLGSVDVSAVVETIRTVSRWYWEDPERHRAGRLELEAARREVVRLAFAELAVGEVALADAIGDAYSRRRDAGLEALPDAIETVRWLRQSGRRLALLTNGAGPAQRRKIVRFGLAELFDVILIEGEMGFGKPDDRVYRQALAALDVEASDAWMVGDNLEWDVTAPQKLGISGVWIDIRGRGLPETRTVRPDHVVSALSDLRALIAPKV